MVDVFKGCKHKKIVEAGMHLKNNQGGKLRAFWAAGWALSLAYFT